MPTSISEIVSRVGRGADLLDQRRPDWWKEIDMDTLVLWTSDKCILGQLYGRWGVGMQELFGHYSSATAMNFGFEAEWADDNEPLEETWMGKIIMRSEEAQFGLHSDV